MARSAKVTSVEAVATMAGAMKRFHEDAAAALEGLNLEVQRALDWVSHRQKDYWAHQVRRGWEQLGEAKANLQRTQVSQRVGDHEPTCLEEKRAVERAKRRLRLAEDKVQAVRKWTRIVDRAALEYQGGVGQLAGWLEIDCHRAIATLERMSTALESYLAVQPVAEHPPDELAGAARAAGVGLTDDDLRTEDKETEDSKEDEEQETQAQDQSAGDTASDDPGDRPAAEEQGP